jgi:DNA-binding transcriptional regulator YhcF (GntR family)
MPHGPIPGRNGTSVREVERAVLSRVLAGQYHQRDRLPTCEQLGRELGANKNTVSKAYQALARRGYVASRPGLGTYVLKPPPATDGHEALAEVTNLLQGAIEQADLIGLTSEEFVTLARETTKRHFDRVTLHVGYVDGNTVDARNLGRELQDIVSTPIEPLSVADVLKDADAVAARFDLLAVNLSHLATVERRLRHARDLSRAEVIPILSLPDPATLTQVARLAPGTRLAVVCETDDFLPALAGLAAAANGSLDIDAKLASNPGLVNTLEWADAVLWTTAAQLRIGRLDRSVPTIEAGYKLDEESIAALADRIAALRRGDRPTLHGPTAAGVRPQRVPARARRVPAGTRH